MTFFGTVSSDHFLAIKTQFERSTLRRLLLISLLIFLPIISIAAVSHPNLFEDPDVLVEDVAEASTAGFLLLAMFVVLRWGRVAIGPLILANHSQRLVRDSLVIAIMMLMTNIISIHMFWSPIDWIFPGASARYLDLGIPAELIVTSESEGWTPSDLVWIFNSTLLWPVFEEISISWFFTFAAIGLYRHSLEFDLCQYCIRDTTFPCAWCFHLLSRHVLAIH